MANCFPVIYGTFCFLLFGYVWFGLIWLLVDSSRRHREFMEEHKREMERIDKIYPIDKIRMHLRQR